MQYLVIMGILIVVAVILIVIIITALMRSRQDDESDYDEDEDDGYDDEDEVREIPGSRREAQYESDDQESGEEEGLHVIGQGRPSKSKSASGEGKDASEDDQDESQIPGKKLWKLVLENLATWQKSTFVFYENVGIGRGHSVPQLEKFLSIGDDPRVSKLHCAIIQKDNKLYLKDMGSKNGTYLNDKRITQPVLIQRDDVIRMGETEIEILSMMREK